MTDVMSDGKAVVELDAGQPQPAVASDELVRQLAERARAEGLRLTGEGGLLSQLTKVVVESALDGELDDHLGYSKHDAAGRDGGNSRNGKRGKTVLTRQVRYPWSSHATARAASILSWSRSASGG